MSQPIRGREGHLVFPIGTENTNLVEDVEILLPVEFRWIPFCGFSEVENVAVNQRQGRPSCFFDRPVNTYLVESCFFFDRPEKKTNMVEDVKILLPVKFCWIPFCGFREVENISANQGRGGHLVFPISPKNTNLVEDIEILQPVKVRWILFCDVRWIVENVSANQRPGRPSCSSDCPEKHNLGRGR